VTDQRVRSESYGQRKLTRVDRVGRWLSLKKILKLLPKDRAFEALDCGCGFEAYMLVALKPYLKRGLGIDLRINPALKSVEGLEFIEVALEETLPALLSQSFDVIFVVSVLEHLAAPQEMLNHCYRLLRSGGSLFVNVPTWRGKRYLELSAFRLGFSPVYEMDDHKMYYDKRDLWPILVKSGFKPSRIKLSYYKFGLNLFSVCRKE